MRLLTLLDGMVSGTERVAGVLSGRRIFVKEFLEARLQPAVWQRKTWWKELKA